MTNWLVASFFSKAKVEVAMDDGRKNQQLSAVLDEEDDDVAAPANTNVDRGAALEDEHLRRLKAEADAQDKATRLQVAQEQLAEYASEKSRAAAELLQRAAELADELTRGGGGASLESAMSQAMQLRQCLQEAAVEAAAFSEQQAEDVERLKRSSQQAQLMDIDSTDHKRAKDAAAADGGVGSTSVNGDDGSAENGAEDADAEQENGALDPAAAAAAPVPRAVLEAASARLGTHGLQATAAAPAGSFRDRCRYIPLRLQLEERRVLRLLEAALSVSEYTDKVDILAWRSKTARMHAQLKDFCAILSGLVVAQDYRRGQALVADRDFAANATFFQDAFEIGRRYKVMNPEKMRSEFGKLIYMLMDSGEPNVQELLGFRCVRPLRTVALLLEERGGSALLDDPLLEVATAEIHSAGRPRALVQRDIKAKERAREGLARRYRNATLSEEEILWAIYSISDNNSYLLFNRDPIDRMIAYFTSTFKPDSHAEGMSLAITGGREGARLTHSHTRQYHYCLQSLLLWREISHDMFRLWCLAEADMLEAAGGYRLCDTGQGLNRVQAAPRVSRAMSGILARCQAALGSWVGSSVVHLGDHNVPNAMFFLNKYTQVPQILNPVVLVLDELPRLATASAAAASYVNTAFGGVEAARHAVLLDFCRHAFDGSGADNFFDAGSCIDGRLTSAWHWCSQLEKKPYYLLFKMAGFVGFDGDFQK